MKNSKYLLSILIILLLSASLNVAQTDRGAGNIKIKKADGKTEEIKLYDASYALVIGNGNYTNGWDNLPGAGSDVAAVKGVLERQNFVVETAENLSSRDFSNRIQKFIDDYGYEANNRLLVYYAGHGHTLKSTGDGRDLGYVVPTDAPLPATDEIGFKRRAIPMDDIQNYAKKIQAKHALFIFDSCFSGRLVTRSAIVVPPIIQELVAYPVRQFITAGAANQPVPDESIFRRSFVRALEGEADRNADGYVTGTELAEYLKEKVTNYSNRQQTPQYGKINDIELDRGDFIFILPQNVEPITAPPISTPPVIAELTPRKSSEIKWEEMLKTLGNEQKLLAETNSELEKNPTGATALRIRSEVLFMLSEQERAKADAEKIIAELSKPQSPYDYEARCYAFRRINKPEDALADCSRAIALDPHYAFAYRSRGLIYMSKKDYENAVRDFSKAIDESPGYARAHLARADAFAAQGKNAEALADYSKTIEINPNHSDFYTFRGTFFWNSKEKEKAIADLDAAVQKDSQNIAALRIRATFNRNLRRDDLALADISKIIALKPDATDLYSFRGTLYIDLKEFEKAVADFSKAIELKPDNASLYFSRAIAYDNLGKKDLAAADRLKLEQLRKN